MSREVRRVPLDFDWPLGETWEGFLVPDRLRVPECRDCDGRGTTPAYRWVEACAHAILMLDDDLDAQARGRAMHPYFELFPTSAYGTRPSADIREIGTGLAGREGGLLGHDACDRWAATRKIIEAAGLDPSTWGRCPACGGSGLGPEEWDGQAAAYDAWRSGELPAGDGWQLWETVSEGSPVTPVFASAQALIDHLATVGESWGKGPMRRSAAEALVRAGSSLGSFIAVGGEVLSSSDDADLVAARLSPESRENHSH